MTNSSSSIRAGFDAEREAIGPFIGTTQTIGLPLTKNPIIIIFDNQSNVSCAVSTDGNATTWKTFSGGEALVLDLRANHGHAYDFTIPIGTQFSLVGTAGTGSFRISIIYAE